MSSAMVTALDRYPVKSMMGESLKTASIGALGIPGDRAWAVREGEKGTLRGAKRFASLMQCRARYTAEIDQPSPPAQITLPDGATFVSTAADASARLGAFLGASVALSPLVPADQLDRYRRTAAPGGDVEAELRRVFARTADEPLPDLSKFPAELFQYESPPGTHFDAYPLLIVSENALSRLNDAAPESQFDVRRFRPNVTVRVAGDEPFPEFAWCGKRARLGTALLAIELECPRCIMTTLPFAELPKDPKIMRALVKHAGGNLGVYAKVLEQGTVRVGDQLTVEN